MPLGGFVPEYAVNCSDDRKAAGKPERVKKTHTLHTPLLLLKPSPTRGGLVLALVSTTVLRTVLYRKLVALSLV
jgi:hypothetical protein